MYHLIFAIIFLKDKFSWSKFKLYIIYTLPFILYYVIYNVIFLGFPAYSYYILGSPAYGQFRQNLGRAAGSRLNIEALQTNLRVLNWFFLPFIAWIILAAGIFYQAKKYWNLVLITLPYAVIWSFYLLINTGHHFLAYFCWLAPFGITYFYKQAEKLGKNIFSYAMIILLLLISSWSYAIHVRIYTYDDYPRYLLPIVYGDSTGWINNIYRPVRKIARDLDEILGPGSTIISFIDGSFRTFYFPEDSRYSPINLSHFEVVQNGNGQCLSLNNSLIKQYKIRAVVSYVDQNICSDIVEKVVEYSGSNLHLTILAH